VAHAGERRPVSSWATSSRVKPALSALVGAGKLPKLGCNPVPRVDDLADSFDDALADGMAEAQADAFHSQYDSA
jgi:hypothetical protein